MAFQLRESTSVANTASRVHYGLGGAGNIATASLVRKAQAQAQARSVTASRSGLYSCGLGGAGNMHSGSERAKFSFDTEQRLLEDHSAVVFHVGCGGSGNCARGESGLSSDSEELNGSAASINSSSSDMSKRLRVGAADRIYDRISGTFSRSSSRASTYSHLD